MPKLFFILFFLFFGSHYCVAQKTIQKEFSAEGIETLVIQDDAVFKINVKAEKTNFITVIVNVAGENDESIVVEKKIINNDLIISTGFMPYFEKINDKLAANKVLSIEMKIIVPIGISLQLKSKIASVNITGQYKNVEAGLEEGNCFLNDFLGNAKLLTKRGNIIVYAQKRVSGFGFSRHSNVKNKLPNKGKYHIEAESINGAISLYQVNF